MKRFQKNIVYIIITIMVTLYLIPLFYMISVSLKKVGTTFDNSFFPKSVTFNNYFNIIISGNYGRYVFNGFIVSISTTLLCIVIGFFAAYSLSRFRFPAKEGFFVTLLAIRIIPPVLIAIAYFKILVTLKIYDTLLALIILNTIFNLPLTVWMLRNFVNAVPKELDDAALVDGCSRWRYLGKILLPLSVTGIASVAVLAFVSSWNEYLFAITFISSGKNKTPTFAIFDFIGQWSTNYIGIVTFALLISLPVIIGLLLVQRYYVKGLFAGSDR